MTDAPISNRRRLAMALLVLAAAGSTAPVAADGGANTGRADQEAGLERLDPANMCFGGLEDGKRIVHETHVENPYRETTKLGCEVDGGEPATMPDLPAPVVERTRLA